MIPPQDEHRHLAADTRARTVLTTAERVEVRLAGEVAQGFAGLLACHDQLFLARPGADALGGSPVTVVCRGPVRGLGVLKLVGRCGTRVRAADIPGVVPLLADRGHAHDAAAELVPVHLDEVRLLLPATRAARAHAVIVDTASFHRAEPDPWVTATDTLGSHLEECHQRELNSLVAADRGRRPGAVVVRSLTREALRVTALFDDGVTDLTLAYGRVMAEVAEVAHWLRESTSR